MLTGSHPRRSRPQSLRILFDSALSIIPADDTLRAITSICPSKLPRTISPTGDRIFCRRGRSVVLPGKRSSTGPHPRGGSSPSAKRRQGRVTSESLQSKHLALLSSPVYHYQRSAKRNPCDLALRYPIREFSAFVFPGVSLSKAGHLRFVIQSENLALLSSPACHDQRRSICVTFSNRKVWRFYPLVCL